MGKKRKAAKSSSSNDDGRKTTAHSQEESSSSSASGSASSPWRGSSSYEFQVDYNDHFETPLIAYQDILPLLLNVVSSTPRKPTPKLYDPYYCNGRTKLLLENQLGFNEVVHRNRDFYKDIANNSIPANYDIMITNPPYSDNHKQQCIEFCASQFRSEKNRPFFLLMPNYIATKQYYKDTLGNILEDVIYVVPSKPYQYDHPEGTGHNISPFDSLWFCCVGKANISRLQTLFNEHHNKSRDGNGENHPPKFVASLQGLEKFGVISTACRPNPRQRKKQRKLQQQQGTDSSAFLSKAPPKVSSSNVPPKEKKQGNNEKMNSNETGSHSNKGGAGDDSTTVANTSKEGSSSKKKKKKTSRYRDVNGNRTKTRF